MAVLSKIRRAVRGEVKLTTAALEVLRRARVSLQQRKERTSVQLGLAEPLSLRAPYAQMSEAALLDHFRGAREARFFQGFLNPEKFPQPAGVIEAANRIVSDHCWPLSGLGEKCFGQGIQWTRDPLSSFVWPADYHRDLALLRDDGSDVRVLWELNRLGHFVRLAQAYSLTSDERFGVEFGAQLRSWSEQNPYGRGANWTCAMEVALRSINLLVAFETFRKLPELDTESLQFYLQLLRQHGAYLRRNLEFSYIATSNHYLSDVVGLLWLGLLLPEFSEAEEWREFGLLQMLREMDKQVLADGADFESSTGYHRFVLELFLYSFLLCQVNGRKIERRYWTRLHEMLNYVRAYLRPDGYAPLLGDTDSGQVLPLQRRRADDHAYLLAIGAVVFNDQRLKVAGAAPEELWWTLGDTGAKAFQEMTGPQPAVSQDFPQAGTYIMRDGDDYLCFNASSAGINGRGSHGHNDALSIEVTAGGQAFIVDPGTYVYSADLDQRHAFRSTAYHSTVRIDAEEQNTIARDLPFVIGNEAKPRVLEWQTSADSDRVVGEHYGYRRLRAPVTHRRSITFNKRERSWLIEDEFSGESEHLYEIRFHFAPGLEIKLQDSSVVARAANVSLLLSSSSANAQPVLESQPVSRDYGQLEDSVSACWHISGRPGKLSWRIEVISEQEKK